jgi:hypothetical protein
MSLVHTLTFVAKIRDTVTIHVAAASANNNNDNNNNNNNNNNKANLHYIREPINYTTTGPRQLLELAIIAGQLKLLLTKQSKNRI